MWTLDVLNNIQHTQVCTYPLDHESTYFAGQYWIAHHINGWASGLNARFLYRAS